MRLFRGGNAHFRQKVDRLLAGLAVGDVLMGLDRLDQLTPPPL